MRYFDFNATTPLRESAKLAMLEGYERFWGNPSTAYRLGAQAKNALESAREKLGEILLINPERIVFCSGASEATNGLFREMRRINGDEASFLVSAIEHPAVTNSARFYSNPGKLETIPVSEDGVVQLESIEKTLAKSSPSLVSLMAINNETGVVQPWHQLSAICYEKGIHFNCDAVQLYGKGSILGLGEVGSSTMSAHKFGGPRGVGALILSEENLGIQMQLGGAQEFDHRAGTENLPGILGMLAAIEETLSEGMGESGFRDSFEARLFQHFGDSIKVNGSAVPRAWNTSSVVLPDFQSARWVSRLDRLGFCVSSGSACSTGKGGPSSVLKAMGLDVDEAKRSVRISSGKTTTRKDWEELAEAIVSTHETLLSESSNGNSMVIEL